MLLLGRDPKKQNNVGRIRIMREIIRPAICIIEQESSL